MKMQTVLIHMHIIAKVDISKYFRTELSQLILGMRNTDGAWLLYLFPYDWLPKSKKISSHW